MRITTRKLIMVLLGASALAGPAARANLLYNTGFEVESAFSTGSALNWKINDPDDHGDAWGSASREHWRAQEGQFMMAIRGTWAQAGDYGGVWQEAEGRSGTSYRLTAWFWADPTWHAQTQEMKLEFWNWDRTQMLGAATNSIEGVGEEWTQKDVVAVAPEGTEWVRAVFNVAGAGAEGALQIDTVDLSPTP